MENTIRTYKTLKHLEENKPELVTESVTVYNKDEFDGVVDEPKKAVYIINHIFQLNRENVENVVILALDGAMQISGAFKLSQGTLNQSLVHPREVFQRLLLVNSSCFMIAHNHPSGVLAVSEQDREVTKRLKEAGELMGISLIDHLIITENSYTSAMKLNNKSQINPA